MSLTTKIPLILVAIVGAYAVSDYLMQRTFILPQFLEIERIQAARDLQRCKGALEREVYHLDRFCLDWAAWDDMYNFVETGNPAFPASNLPPPTFLNYNLNMLYIVNKQGSVLWGRTCRFEAGNAVELPAFLPQSIALTHPLLQHNRPKDSVAGLVMTEQGPLMLSSHPIFPSLNWKESNGTLLMGRFVSSEFLKTLGQQTHVDLEMYPLDGRLLPPEAPSRRQLETMQTTYVSRTDQKVLHAYEAYPDVYGRPAILFRVSLPREIFQRGLVATKLDAVSAVVAGLFILLAGIYFIRRTVTIPLQRLSAHVTGITKSHTLPLYHAPRREDEIGSLALELNQMIFRLREDLEVRQNAEQAVRDREQRLQAVLDAAPDGIITVDEAGIIESANPAAGQILLYSPQDLEQQSLALILPVADNDNFQRILQEILAGTNDHGFLRGREIQVCRRDGTQVPVHIKINVVALQDRKICTGIIRDLTEFKMLHERVLQSQHLASIGEMGASIAHEIRNPLAGISGAVQVLLRDLPETSPHHRIMSQVLGLVARVENTVRQLLSYAKDWQPRKQSLPVLGYVRSVCSDWELAQRYPNIKVTFQGDGAAKISADPGLFAQVCTNLTENAVQAMNGDGTITWSVARENGRVLVVLEDHGPGLKPEARAQLFKPFFTTKTTGTGLGLAICKRIVEAHQATIDLRDGTAGGTVVIMSFKGEDA